MFKTTVSIDNLLADALAVTTEVTPSLWGDYWQGEAGTAGADGVTATLWMSRDDGITDHDTWVFTTSLTVAGVVVQLQEQVTGTLLGSDIAIQIVAGSQSTGWETDDISLTFTGTDGVYRITGIFARAAFYDVYDDVTYTVAKVSDKAILPQIQHVVVLMFENRSFDNLLGWTYADGPPPSQFLPPRPPLTYDGLLPEQYSNTDSQVNGGHPVHVSRGTTPWRDGDYDISEWFVPSPDPGEEFDHVTTQIFNDPKKDHKRADMSGFLTDYVGRVTHKGDPAAVAAQIMQTYGPHQLPVINGLARCFAVSDAWFASMPTQTWPNRGFLQTGCSDGRTNNDFFLPWDINTIFDVCAAQHIRWKVYNDGPGPSMTKAMFLAKYLCNTDNFGRIDEFEAACRQPASAPAMQKLPSFTFLEPHFGVFEPRLDESYHPPNDVRPAELFLAKIYDTLRNCPYRDEILFVVLFDEHGGTYDHVSPPAGAAAPLPHPVTIDGSHFRYDRFGVRVPAIVISSYVKKGTVFRSDTDVPLDHTSVLATLRDWLGLQDAFTHMLPSPRIAAAPNLAHVLTETEPQGWEDLSTIIRDLTETAQQIAPPADDEPLNDIQRSLLVCAAGMAAKNPYSRAETQAAFTQLKTHGDARSWVAELAPHLPLK